MQKPRSRHEQHVLVALPYETDEPRRFRAAQWHRRKRAVAVEFRRRGAIGKQDGNDALLDPSIRPGRDQVDKITGARQRCLARGIIDWAPIVGIHQRKIPEFGALIKIGNPRQRDLQDRACQPVEHAVRRKLVRERHDRSPRCRAGLEKKCEKLACLCLVRAVGIGPRGVALQFA